VLLWEALAEARPRPSGESSINEFSKWTSCLIGTRSIRMSLMPGCPWPSSLRWRTCRECKFVANPRKLRGRKPSWKDGLGIELVRDVDALRQTKKINYEQAIKELRRDKEKPWRAYSLPNLIARHRDARKAEQHRRHFAERFKPSPISQAMGSVFWSGSNL